MEVFIEPETGGRDAAGSASNPESGLSVECRRRRVLIVDDNAQSAKVLANVLRLWGHDTRVNHDGQAALHSARAYRPDVVLLDINMPDMDGYAVARALRGHSEFDGMTLLAMTGHGRDEDRRAAIEAGFDRHLLKPLELDALENLLSGVAPAREPASR